MSNKDVIPPSPTRSDYGDEAANPPGDIFLHQEPFDLFRCWLGEARKKELNDPNAMALSTADASGFPDVRMVLLKGIDSNGLTFYTNTESAKGEQLSANPRAAICFHWKSLRRQVRVRGLISQVGDEEADTYFNSRARDSRIGAWASRQSRPLESRLVLENAVAGYAARFDIADVPRPPHWTGFRLTPLRFEFWRDRAFRLHDRMVFERTAPDQFWVIGRLYP